MNYSTIIETYIFFYNEVSPTKEIVVILPLTGTKMYLNWTANEAIHIGHNTIIDDILNLAQAHDPNNLQWI